MNRLAAEVYRRFLLEDFEFPYTTIRDDEILRGDLHERWDVIVLPNDSRGRMVDGRDDPMAAPPG